MTRTPRYHTARSRLATAVNRRRRERCAECAEPKDPTDQLAPGCTDQAVMWNERELVSVANLTRADATEFLAFASEVPLRVEVRPYALERANEALADLRSGAVKGAAVLVPQLGVPLA